MVSGHWPKAIWSSHLANVFYSTIRNLSDYFAIRARANKKRNTINKQWKGTKQKWIESTMVFYWMGENYSCLFNDVYDISKQRATTKKKASRKFFTFRRESERRKNGVSIHTKNSKACTHGIITMLEYLLRGFQRTFLLMTHQNKY